MEIATLGPIVVFNVSELRCDALLIEGSGIRLITLPSLTAEDLESKSEIFLNLVLMGHFEAKNCLKRILEWLWDVAVSRILSALGFTTTPRQDAEWPRMWWIGSGLLTLLPIHAAGYHDNNKGQNVLDRVISSYTTTIQALAYARDKAAHSIHSLDQNALLVGMSETPGHSKLQYVEQEIEELRLLLSPHMTITVEKKPTKERILAALSDYQIVHLACHGTFDENDPSQSKLLLSDWQTEPLTVSNLASQALKMSQFAYLSACHTASARNLSLLDESIHLASSFQIAGYPSVVGTLWEVGDAQSATLAKDVYAMMLRGGSGLILNTRKSAEALHMATRSLRSKTKVAPMNRESQSDPLIWAPYIHIGI